MQSILFKGKKEREKDEQKRREKESSYKGQPKSWTSNSDTGLPIAKILVPVCNRRYTDELAVTLSNVCLRLGEPTAKDSSTTDPYLISCLCDWEWAL
jgi:hypothetical protein